VYPVRYELGFYIPEDGILHSHRRENLKPYIVYVYKILFLAIISLHLLVYNGIGLTSLPIWTVKRVVRMFWGLEGGCI
jgi:hypothetical protein